MPDLSFRPIQQADLSAIADITVSAFVHVSIDAQIEQRYGVLNGSTWGERKVAAVLSEIEATPEGCFVALLDGTVVGYITTSVDSISSTGRILNLALTPACQGQGIGKQLLIRAFTYFRERELGYYRIETTSNNEVGQALYPRCGFHEITRQIIYFMSADEAANWTGRPTNELERREDA